MSTQTKEYKVVKAPFASAAMAFDKRTPDDLCQLLARLNVSRERVQIVYGDVTTGERWESGDIEKGVIGRSTGTFKVPLLIQTIRSTGGDEITSSCILQVRLIKDKSILWSHNILQGKE